MTTLITGGMGVIGSFATMNYLEAGERPLVLSRSVDRTILGDNVERIDHVAADVSDMDAVREIFEQHQIDAVIHTAGLTGAGTKADPHQSVRINVLGTANLLEAARLFGVKRFVFASAKGIYGHIDDESGYPTYKPITENREPRPIRLYEYEKVMSEALGNFYRAQYGIEFAALRFATTYGPGKTVRHGPMAVTSAVVEQPLRGEPYVLEQGGDEGDDFIYNRDAGEALYLAATTTTLNYSAYNIGTGVARTFHEFGAVVSSLVPGADIRIGPGLKFFGLPTAYYYVYDVTRAAEDLGFRAKYDLESGIADYIRIVKSKGEGTR